jgi:hypothetical protein
MIRVVMGLWGLLFLTSNISKWYLNFGVRINYYIPVLALWVVLALIVLARPRISVPQEIRNLIALKVLLGIVVGLSGLVVFSQGSAELMGTYLRGLTAYFIGVVGIVTGLLLLGTMTKEERSGVVDLYLLSIAISSVYTLLQALMAYRGELDLDLVVGSALPFAGSEPPSIEEDIWSGLGQKFYRLSGLTGDPNVSAMTFLLALPAILYRSKGRNPIPFAGLALVCVGIIAQSVSGTVIPLTIVMIGILARKARHGGRLIAALLVGGIGLGVLYLALNWSGLMLEFVSTKFSAVGTASEHLKIAGNAVGLWSKHPLGLGLNAFAVYSSDFSAHNSYLQRLVELGVQGLTVTFITVGYMLHVAFRHRSGFGWVAFLVIGAVAVGAMGHDLLFRFEFEFICFLWVGIAVLDGTIRSHAASDRPAQGHAAVHSVAPG